MGRYRHTIEMCLGFFRTVDRDRSLPAGYRRRARHQEASARDLLMLVDGAELEDHCHARLLQREALRCANTVRELTRASDCRDCDARQTCMAPGPQT